MTDPTIAPPLSAEYRRLYDRLLERVAQAKRQRNNLCAFWPLIGTEFRPSEGILAVGRAVNGWRSGSFLIEDLRLPEKRHDVLDRASGYRGDLGWVAEREGDSGYNTRRSQFWMVLKEVVARRTGQPLSSSWSQQLAWTNLYKVAPSQKGNPTLGLRRVQREPGSELLRHEITTLKPRAVVFLTGLGWARHFLDLLDVDYKTCLQKGLAERGGLVEGVPFVVARHPQRKSRGKWVDETWDMLEAVTGR